MHLSQDPDLTVSSNYRIRFDDFASCEHSRRLDCSAIDLFDIATKSYLDTQALCFVDKHTLIVSSQKHMPNVAEPLLRPLWHRSRRNDLTSAVV